MKNSSIVGILDTFSRGLPTGSNCAYRNVDSMWVISVNGYTEMLSEERCSDDVVEFLNKMYRTML